MLVLHHAPQQWYIWRAPLHGILYSALEQALVPKADAVHPRLQLLGNQASHLRTSVTRHDAQQ